MDKKTRLILAGALITILIVIAIYFLVPARSTVDPAIYDRSAADSAQAAQQAPPEPPAKPDFKPKGFAPH